MKPARVSAEAEEGIALAVEWYEEQRPSLGESFLLAVREAVSEIPTTSGLCSPVLGLSKSTPARWKRVRGFPYRLVFTELTDCYLVVSAPHDRRRPLYWTDRLAPPS